LINQTPKLFLTKNIERLRRNMDCYFCQRNIKDIDFKDTEGLQRFISSLAKIKSRKKTGLCAKHQRQLSKAIKRARHFGLLPYTTK